MDAAFREHQGRDAVFFQGRRRHVPTDAHAVIPTGKKEIGLYREDVLQRRFARHDFGNVAKRPFEFWRHLVPAGHPRHGDDVLVQAQFQPHFGHVHVVEHGGLGWRGKGQRFATTVDAHRKRLCLGRTNKKTQKKKAGKKVKTSHARASLCAASRSIRVGRGDSKMATGACRPGTFTRWTSIAKTGCTCVWLKALAASSITTSAP